jgi:DNA-binding CsgD family transcriptional regulator/tetratricopeptide (TPR) repeat protein
VLVERDELVARIRTATGAFVVVSGEAGAGKTALVQAALTGAAWGWCEPLSTPRPLGPFRDIARALWPGLRDLGVPELRERLLDSPTPLVVEDAHWIDEASADLLRFLGRRVGSGGGLVVVTTRDELVADHPLRRVLGDLSTAVARIEVPPLSAAAVAALVDGVEPAEAYRLTGGNAFLVSQLAGDRVAASVRDSVAARLARLDPAARDAVELLSVVPGRVPVALAGAEEDRLDAAVLAGLVRVDGPVVEFRHELVRLAVEQGLPPGRTRQLHGRVLAGLGPDAEPAAVAYHAWRARRPELAIASELAAAGKAAALGAHGDAAEHYRRALTGDPKDSGPGPGAETAAVWVALSREEYLVGRDRPALDAARRGVALSGEDPRSRAAAVGWLSRVVQPEAEARALAAEAVRLLEPFGPSPALAAAVARVAMAHMIARDLDDAEEQAARALALLGPDDAPGAAEAEAVALEALGGARTLAGKEPDLAHLRRALELTRAAGLDGELGRVYANLVSAAGEARLYPLAAELAAEALDYFLARDLDGSAAYTRAWTARCLYEQGRWDEAGAQLDLIGADRTITLVTAETVRGRIRARRGDGDPWPPLERAREAAATTGSLQRIAPVAAARAEARWLAGAGPDGDLAEAYALAKAKRIPWVAGELALWMHRHGRLDGVPAVAAEPYRLQLAGEPVAAGEAWLAIGCPYEAADALADARDEAPVRRALELFTTLGARPGRQRAARRLRELGVRSIPRGPRDSTTADGLTAREREVLEHLRTGETDGEIAARLHLSTKTVGHHVSAVLRKTGVRSRRELRNKDRP